jgi:hypothetical protein
VGGGKMKKLVSMAKISAKHLFPNISFFTLFPSDRFILRFFWMLSFFSPSIPFFPGCGEETICNSETFEGLSELRQLSYSCVNGGLCEMGVRNGTRSIKKRSEKRSELCRVGPEQRVCHYCHPRLPDFLGSTN